MPVGKYPEKKKHSSFGFGLVLLSLKKYNLIDDIHWSETLFFFSDQWRYRIWAFCNALWYWKGDKTKENSTGKMIWLSLLRAPTDQNAFIFSEMRYRLFYWRMKAKIYLSRYIGSKLKWKHFTCSTINFERFRVNHSKGFIWDFIILLIFLKSVIAKN